MGKTMTDEDQELVALIDNELDEDRRNRLLERLEEDPALRARYEALRDAGAPIGAAFDALLERAPLARLRQAIPPETAARRAPGRFAGLAFRELAAGFVIGLLAAGAAAWLALGAPRSDEDSDWRAAVVDYMGLYTNETFAFVNPDRETQAKELSAVGKRVGADLTPEKRKRAGPGFQGRVHSRLRRRSAGRNRLRRSNRRADALLRHRQRHRRRASALRKARRVRPRHMDPQRARLSGDRPSAGTAGR